MPPKKKKSGKRKLAKMTEEEKLLYMEQKRLAEEEMKKKKEDMLTQFLKVPEIEFVQSLCMIAKLFYISVFTYLIFHLISIVGQVIKRRKKYKIQFKQASKPVEGHNERRCEFTCFRRRTSHMQDLNNR